MKKNMFYVFFHKSLKNMFLCFFKFLNVFFVFSNVVFLLFLKQKRTKFQI